MSKNMYLLSTLFVLRVAQSRLTLCNPMTVVCQVPLSMELSRQEYWSGLPFPPPENLPDAGIESGSHALRADSLLSERPEKPHWVLWNQAIYNKSDQRSPTGYYGIRQFITRKQPLPIPQYCVPATIISLSVSYSLNMLIQSLLAPCHNRWGFSSLVAAPCPLLFSPIR